jgi:hypothetical protein
MHRAVNRTIEEEVFLYGSLISIAEQRMCFMGPFRDYIRSREQNENEYCSALLCSAKNENGASPRQSRKKGSAEDWFEFL